MGAKEFQQAQSKTESQVGASQAAGETAAPACTGLPGTPHCQPFPPPTLALVVRPSQLLPPCGWEGRRHIFLNFFLLTISNLCDFQESFPKLSSHEEMRIHNSLEKGPYRFPDESLRVQLQEPLSTTLP